MQITSTTKLPVEATEKIIKDYFKKEKGLDVQVDFIVNSGIEGYGTNEHPVTKFCGVEITFYQEF